MMEPTKETRLWLKKTYDPYYTEIAKGIVKFDDRMTQDDFPVKAGDWVVFELWEEKRRISLRKQVVKAVEYVRNTGEVLFWKKFHEIINFKGITIMQFTDPSCPACKHEVFIIPDEDNGFDMSYFQCQLDGCTCVCEESIDLTYEHSKVKPNERK